MAFSFSKHALGQMKERNISIEVAEAILNSPAEVVGENENTVYHGITSEKEKHYLIRIFVNRSVEPNKVVTIYKTSRIRKYYEGKI